MIRRALRRGFDRGTYAVYAAVRWALTKPYRRALPLLLFVCCTEIALSQTVDRFSGMWMLAAVTMILGVATITDDHVFED